MDKMVQDLENDVELLEARPAKEILRELMERIEDLMLEENLTVGIRKRLKELKIRVKALDVNKPTNQYLLNNDEIFIKQKKLLYDCEKMGLNASEELERQNAQLEDSQTKVFKIDGKLISSSGVLLTIKRNIQKNTVMLRIVVYTLILVFFIILMMKVFG